LRSEIPCPVLAKPCPLLPPICGWTQVIRCEIGRHEYVQLVRLSLRCPLSNNSSRISHSSGHEGPRVIKFLLTPQMAASCRSCARNLPGICLLFRVALETTLTRIFQGLRSRCESMNDHGSTYVLLQSLYLPCQNVISTSS
jgi:hypothetical protein